MFVVECCLLSGRGPCEEPITRPEESYRLWCVIVCDLETSRMWGLWPALGRSATGGKICFCVTRLGRTVPRLNVTCCGSVFADILP